MTRRTLFVMFALILSVAYLNPQKNCLISRQFFYWKNEWDLLILFEILVNFFGDLGSFNTNLT